TRASRKRTARPRRSARRLPARIPGRSDARTFSRDRPRPAVAHARGTMTLRRRSPATTKRRAAAGLRARPLQLVPLPSAHVATLARVAEARRRIAAGWYDRSEVRDSLVDAVLQEIRGH